MFWDRVIGQLDQRDGDFEIALGYMRQHKAIEATIEAAHARADKAREALSIFPANEWRQALEALAGFVVERVH